MRCGCPHPALTGCIAVVSFIRQVAKLDEAVLAEKLRTIKTHMTTMNFVVDNMDGTLAESKRKVAALSE